MKAKAHVQRSSPPFKLTPIFQVANALPRLPKNAVWFYSQQSSCVVGLGLVAELFASGTVKKADYNYFIILTSSVRGPFIPGFSLVITYLLFLPLCLSLLIPGLPFWEERALQVRVDSLACIRVAWVH